MGHGDHSVYISRFSISGSNLRRAGVGEAKSADFSKLGLTGYSGDKVISQRDIQRLVCAGAPSTGPAATVQFWDTYQTLPESDTSTHAFFGCAALVREGGEEGSGEGGGRRQCQVDVQCL